MKLYTLLLVVLLLNATQCDINDDDDGNSSESYTYEFYEDSEIVVVNDQGFEYINIDNGINTVFKYIFVAEEEEQIADDEYAEFLHFEIDPDLDSFTYSDDELLDLQMYMQRSCFCASLPLVPISAGMVTGTKQSNGNWNISMSISFAWDEQSETVSRTIEGVFSAQ